MIAFRLSQSVEHIYIYTVLGQLAFGLLACGQLAWRITGMRKIGMEDNNWH